MPARQNIDGHGARHQAEGSAERGRCQSIEVKHGMRRSCLRMRGRNGFGGAGQHRNHRLQQSGQGVGGEGVRRFGHALRIRICRKRGKARQNNSPESH